MRIVYVMLMVLLSNLGFGQPVESRKNVREDAVGNKGISIQTDTLQIKKLVDLYYRYRKVDPSIALSYLRQAQSIAFNLNYPNKVAFIQYHKGYLYRLLGNYDLAIRSYISSLDYYTSVNDESKVAWILIDIGNLYYIQSEKLLLAKEHFERAKELFQKLNDDQGFALAENNTGMVLLKMNKWEESLPFFFSSIKKSEQINDVDEKILSLYYIGEAYQQGGRLDSALHYIEKSFAICTENKKWEGIAFGYEHLARWYVSKGNINQAFQQYEQAYEKYKELKDPLNSSLVLTKISALQQKNHQVDNAISYALQAQQIAEKHELISVMMETLPSLSSYYESKSDYKNAYNYLKQYQKLKESNAISNLKKIQTEYETDIRIQEAALFKKQKELKDAHIYAQQVLISCSVSGAVVFLVLFVFIWIRSRQLKESYEMLFKYVQERVKKEVEIEQIKKKEKYSGSQLSAEGNKLLYDNLLALMEQEKVYLSNKLTIEEVAKKLATNRSYLSQMINDQFKTNFNNFINEYRIKDAQRLLLENDSNNYSIEGISQSVGFSSKSTFNAAFKKFTGMRPSDFIQQKKDLDSKANDDDVPDSARTDTTARALI